MKKLSILFAFLILSISSSFSQSDMGFDPCAPQGADYLGFKSKIKPYLGNTVIWTTMDLVCVAGQGQLDFTQPLVFDSNSVYYITPAILTMYIKDFTGAVIASQTIDQWHIANSSQRNYQDPLRVSDTIANWSNFIDPNLPSVDGNDYDPQMSAGYGNSFWGDNEAIPVYIVLPVGFSTGDYEFCAVGDFSYFVNESNDPNEFPDSWCYAVHIDMAALTVDKIAYPSPPAPIAAADVSYIQGGDPVVTWDGTAEYYEVEPFVKKGHTNDIDYHKGLNPVSVNGNSYEDPMMKNAPLLLFGTDKGIKFYYRIRPVNNGVKGDWKITEDTRF